MKILIKIVFSIILMFSLFSAHAQIKRTFSGVLLNSIDSTPVADAHVINFKTKKVTSTDVAGRFSIPIRENDTLIISKIGYQPIELSHASIKKIVYLEKMNYELNQFDVMPYSNYQAFRQAFAKKVITDNNPKINNSEFLSIDERRTHSNASRIGRSGFGVTFGGAISGLASMFNKRMKDKKRYERLLQQDKYEAPLVQKYNPDIVKEITKFESSSKLNDFIAFCSFSNHYIEHHSSYDIITRIYECYDEYTALSQDN